MDLGGTTLDITGLHLILEGTPDIGSVVANYGSLTGTEFASVTDNTALGLSLEYDGGTITIIPEPGTIALVGIAGILGLIGVRRRS